MTNTHCDVCGDPLFRYQGTTFCPSCHGGPEGVEASVDDGAGDGDRTTAAGSTQETRADEHPSSKVPAEETEAANDPEHAAPSVDAGNADRSAATPETRATSSTVNEEPGPGASRETSDTSGPADVPNTSGTARTSPASSPIPSSGSGSDVDVGSDLEAGTDALVTALERFSRAAAEADDPRYAKACLEAAHEAAATLATLRE